jgi:hypothetical protein
MATQGPIHDPETVHDPMIDPRTGEYAVIAPGHNFRSVTQKIAGIVLTGSTPWGWWGGLFFASTVALGVVIGVTWLVLKGVGIWGVTIPGAWGFAIINFVWWIGIGHAGTLISAILLLFKQRRYVPAAAHWASMVGVLAVPVSEHDERLAAVPESAGMGRFRGFHLRDDLDRVLVHRHGAGLRHVARPRQVADREVPVWSRGVGLARVDTALDSV